MAEKLRTDAGYEAEKLDPAIAASIDRLTKVVADVERIRGGLEPLLDAVRERVVLMLAGGALDDARLQATADRLISWMEKYAKAAGTLAKVVDETSRLRSFISGGADTRPDLATLSDAELARVVISAAREAQRPVKA